MICIIMSSESYIYGEALMNDITVRRPIEWISHSASDVGTVRTQNEDSCLVKPESGLWVVADGMGGHEAGNVASQMIVDTLMQLDKPARLSDYVTEIEKCIIDVNQRLLEFSEIMLDGRMVGSTFVSLVIHGQIGICMWMGDSRLYRYRANELNQISKDHSQVMELLEAGAITEEEAKQHPDANVITRAVGTSDELYIDLDIFDAKIGDVYLLCSDGLYNALNESAIISVLQDKDTDQIVSDLMSGALENGATDNVTVVAVKGRRMPVNVEMAAG